jgi:zinc protease
MKSLTNRLAPLILTLLLPALPAQGAQFYFEKDASLPLVYVTAAFRGGATQDPEGKSGVTSLMGKLMLRGTKNRTKQQIDLALDTMGASLDFETRAEFIAFRGVVLAEQLPAYLSLLSEILTTPSFRGQELDKLKKEEISSLLNDLSNDRNLARLRFDETFFKGHPYSKPAPGKLKDLKNLSVGDLQAQFQRLIHEDSMILLASGSTEESSFQPLIQKLKSKRPGISKIQTIPEFKGEPGQLRVVIFDKPDRTQTQVVIGQKGISIRDADLDALQLANHAFGAGGFQARLMVELRVKRGWTYGAGSAFRLGSTPHSWKVSFFPKNADTPAAIQEAIRLISEFGKKGLTPEEFEASRKSLVNGAGFTFNTPAKRMENRLTEIIFGLPEGYFRQYRERTAALTLEQVNAAVARFVRPENLMVGLVGTAKTSKAGIAKTLQIPENRIEVQDYQKE